MFFVKRWNIPLLATKKPFVCKVREMCGITPIEIENNFVNTLTQVKYGCKTTWVSLSFLADCNSTIIESISKAYIFFAVS